MNTSWGTNIPAPPSPPGPLDCHIHMIGNGSSGSGCRLNLRGGFRLMAHLMLRHHDLPGNALTGDLDRLYVERLLRLVRESSLTAAVILALDNVHDEQGRVMPEAGTLYVPNDYVLDLADRHPEFLPAVSIHPARPDALDELDRCLARGAVMLKLLPSGQNINCSDKRYTKFWEKMAAARLPLLAHTGHEFTVKVIDRKLADPERLELPLACGVTVIAAHSATDAGLFALDYFPAFARMLGRHNNLYGDNSAFNMPLNSRGFKLCMDPAIIGRMLYGSDCPVMCHGHWAWLRGRLDWHTLRRWQRHPNALERDLQFKRAAGFPPESFTRLWELLRIP